MQRLAWLLSCVALVLAASAIGLTFSGQSTATLPAAAAASPAVAPTPTPERRVQEITFEGARLAGVSGAGSVIGPVVLETTAPLNGLASARVAASDAFLQSDFPPTDDLYVVFTLCVDALPSAPARILLISNGGVTVGNIYLTTQGRLQLRAGSTVVGTSARLLVGATVRVALHQRSGAEGDALLEATLAIGSAPFRTPFAATSAGTWATPADRVRFGATNSSIVAVTFDDIRLEFDEAP